MLFKGQRVYEDIVQVYMNESYDVFPEYQSHQLLEGLWCIAVSLLHHEAHECAKDGHEGRFNF